MSEQNLRQDIKTEVHMREALAMQRAFGDAAANKFLKLRGIDQALAQRVLTAPPEQRRY